MPTMPRGTTHEARAALITGASSGIGAATAVALGRLGWPVALGARRLDRLQEVAQQVEKAGGSAFAHVLDVADPVSIETFFSAAEAALGPLEVIVSNAGIGVPGLLHEADVETLRREVTVNLLGPMWVARRAIPPLLELGRTASKQGLEGLARVLQMELDGSGVRTTIVRPGPTGGTEFGADWGGEMAKQVLASWRSWGVMRRIVWMPPESVANAIVDVVTAPFDLVQLVPQGPRSDS
jgi:NADP-dependent 3-hydroxy acid dehydrogenase YdfG